MCIVGKSRILLAEKFKLEPEKIKLPALNLTEKWIKMTPKMVYSAFSLLL